MRGVQASGSKEQPHLNSAGKPPLYTLSVFSHYICHTSPFRLQHPLGQPRTCRSRIACIWCAHCAARQHCPQPQASGRSALANHQQLLVQGSVLECTPSVYCNPLRPLIKIFFSRIPYDYMISTKRIPKEMTVYFMLPDWKQKLCKINFSWRTGRPGDLGLRCRQKPSASALANVAHSGELSIVDFGQLPKGARLIGRVPT